MSIPKMKTIAQLMEETGMSYNAIRKLCLDNKIVHIRAGTKYLINEQKFIDYLNAGVLNKEECVSR